MKRIVSLWICVMLLGSTALATNSNNEHEQTNNCVDLSVNPLDITYADYPMENHSIKLTVTIQGDQSNTSDWGKYGYVLDVGGTGEEQAVDSPSIIKEGPNSYIMWYSGLDSAGAYRIYRASSSDGFSWIKDGLAIDNGPGEQCHVAYPNVLIDENGTYQMWYSGYGGPSGHINWKIFRATSSDGYNWVKQGLELQGTSGDDYCGALMPFVLYDNNQWKMWYTGFYKAMPSAPDEFNIMYAYKTNLTDPWIKYGTVIDNTGEYDWPQAFSPCVIKTTQNYEMYYSGYNAIDTTSRVLHATSPDGLSWTRTGIVFEPTLSDEGTNVFYPSVIIENNVSRMWYAGGPGAGNHGRIFYAQNNNTIEYGHNATCDLTIYLNQINPNNIINYFTNVNVSYDDKTSLSTYCNLPAGTYSLIAEIKNVTPSDYDISNNIASKTIIVYPYYTDWPMLGHNVQHTSNNPFTEAPDEANLSWSFNLKNASSDGPVVFIGGGPVAIYGNVYFRGAGNNKSLFCFNQVTGDMIWNYTFNTASPSSPTVKDGKIYVNVRGTLYCLNAYTGAYIWSQNYGYSSHSSPIINDDRLYLGLSSYVICISIINQSIIWTSDPIDAEYNTPAISGDHVYYTTRSGYLFSVNKWTGVTNWYRYFDIWGVRNVLCSNGKLYFGNNYRWYCLDENTGDTIWYKNCPTRTGGLAAVNMNRVYLSCYYIFDSFGITYCADADTGEVIWETPIGSDSALAIADGKIYLGEGCGNSITCLDESNGDILWSYGLLPSNTTIVSFPSSPAVVDGRVFVGSYDGNFRCFIRNPEELNATATATGPQGAGHDPIITLTYTWNGTPNAVDLFYSLNHGETWNYIGTDSTVDGIYNWTPPDAYPCPKPRKYYWIANAQGGADDVGIPPDGTPPEAGPYNWKTWDVTLGASSKGPGNIGWFFVSVPLNVSGNLTTVFDDSNWGDGGTTWDYIMWYDSTDSVKPWKTYSKYRPESLNDQFDYSNLMGVWIHITSNDKDGFLTAGSGDNSTSTAIPLYAGWNMVGYPSLNTETVANALWGTGADRVEMFDSSDPYRLKEVGPTYLMKPGEGYWVHVPADTVWVVDW